MSGTVDISIVWPWQPPGCTRHEPAAATVQLDLESDRQIKYSGVVRVLEYRKNENGTWLWTMDAWARFHSV